MKAYFYESLDSTNEEAKRLLAAGEITGPSYVLAKAQTAGRGTQGRTWVSPPGAGIYLTLIHPATQVIPLTTAFTLAAGVACAEALEEELALAVQLKPVNDLYANGCKLGGILTESLVQEGRVRALITGIGLNLRHVERAFPEAEAARCTPISLQELLPPHQFERLLPQALVEVIAGRVNHWYAKAFEDTLSDLPEAYAARQLPGTVFPGAIAQ